MARVDLDARRAARSEAENTPHEVTLGGRVYQLRPRMPLEFTDLLTKGQSAAAMQLLLVNPADWQDLREQVPDEDDLLAIAELYGVDLPESPASEASSPSDGPTSRPTSSPTTTSTSPPPATAPTPSASAASPA